MAFNVSFTASVTASYDVDVFATVLLCRISEGGGHAVALRGVIPPRLVWHPKGATVGQAHHSIFRPCRILNFLRILGLWLSGSAARLRNLSAVAVVSADDRTARR